MLGLIQHSRRAEDAQQVSRLANGPAITASLETGGRHLGSLYLSDWLSGQCPTVSEGKRKDLKEVSRVKTVRSQINLSVLKKGEKGVTA